MHKSKKINIKELPVNIILNNYYGLNDVSKISAINMCIDNQLMVTSLCTALIAFFITKS